MVMKLYYKLFKEYKIIEDCINYLRSKKLVTCISKVEFESFNSEMYKVIINNNTILIERRIIDMDLSFHLHLNNKKVKTDEYLVESLFCSVRVSYDDYHKLCELLCNLIKVNSKEMVERIEEFEIIKDNNIDLISVNNLYDYYNKRFIEEDFYKLYRQSVYSQRIYNDAILTEQETL